MLGIIGAMDEEVAKLKEKMEQVHIIEKQVCSFTEVLCVTVKWLW